MADKIDDFHSLSKEDLEIKKLRMEVSLLQDQYGKLYPVGFLTRVSDYFQKNLGQVLAICTLLAALVSPVINYIADAKKSQLININKSILNLAGNNDSVLTAGKILEVATQDPNVIAPFLLSSLNEHSSFSINFNKIDTIYTVMYKVNNDLSDKSFLDKLVFFFIDDNKSIIEDKLFSNFVYQFDHPDLSNKTKLYDVWKTYIRIIYGCGLDKDKRFIKELKKIKDQANDTPGNVYKIILTIIQSKQQSQ